MKRVSETALEKVAFSVTVKFKLAAIAWENGSNSGNPATLERENRSCMRWREQAEKQLEPFGITVDYPGLYPTFRLNYGGIVREYRDVRQALAVANGDKESV